jgi:hypothetical protein
MNAEDRMLTIYKARYAVAAEFIGPVPARASESITNLVVYLVRSGYIA